MNGLPRLPELTALAQRTLWYKSPEVALSDLPLLVAHVLTSGSHEDVRLLRRHLPDAILRDALEHAPPGVFDPRSWAYWRLMLDLPRRAVPGRLLPDTPGDPPSIRPL